MNADAGRRAVHRAVEAYGFDLSFCLGLRDQGVRFQWFHFNEATFMLEARRQ